jgi:NADPH:quinone reductase-like Zn-dependent oxidoreductase
LRDWSGEVPKPHPKQVKRLNILIIPTIGEIPGVGGYSPYTVANEKICFKVPENVSSNDAATVPLAATTAWLALYSESCLNIPRIQDEATPILIWGGSCKLAMYKVYVIDWVLTFHSKRRCLRHSTGSRIRHSSCYCLQSSAL